MKRNHQHGFSLIELLIAIFILGIGIISIAALFPAGIAQQQKSTDDLIGSIVARNALTIIRSKVEQEDFGDPRDFVGDDSLPHGNIWSWNVCGANFGQNQDLNINPYETICGDWMWRRPALIRDNVTEVGLRGAIDIFGSADFTNVMAERWPTGIEPPFGFTPPGMPYSKARYPDYEDPDDNDATADALSPPVIRILAGERQYPMWEGNDPNERPKAQYYWDCMFRRYQGRILVAIFVYRVIDPANDGAYTIDTNGIFFPSQPFTADLTSLSTGSWPDADDTDGVELDGSQGDDPSAPEYQWQLPGQWLVDQNGIVHKVQRGRRRDNDSAVRLASTPAGVPIFSSIGNSDDAGVNANWWDKDNVSFSDAQVQGYGVVTDIWYIPTEDSKGRTIVPVYATVEDL